MYYHITVCGVNHYEMAIGDFINITSPNYPEFYFDNQNCTWIFSSSQNGSYLVEIYDLVLDGLVGRGDEFVIGRSGISSEIDILRTSYFIAPDTTILIDDNVIWMTFQSGDRVQSKGFQIGITMIDTNSKCKQTSHALGYKITNYIILI